MLSGMPSAQWEPVEDGIELLRASDSNSITYIRVSLDRFDVRVATPRVHKFGTTAPSDSNAYSERSPRGLLLDDYIARYDALAAISAGYVETISPPTPLGLIKSDGVTIGTAHSSWATEGAFCSDKGRASIEIATSTLDADYRDCLQVGPILLLNGNIPKGLPSSSGSGGDFDKMMKGEVGQAMVCIDSSGRALFGLARRMPLATM